MFSKTPMRLTLPVPASRIVWSQSSMALRLGWARDVAPDRCGVDTTNILRRPPGYLQASRARAGGGTLQVPVCWRSMRVFRRSPRRISTVSVAPEFGIRLTLRKGDRIVRRDARGAIHITRVTQDRVEVTDVCRGGPPPARGRSGG